MYGWKTFFFAVYCYGNNDVEGIYIMYIAQYNKSIKIICISRHYKLTESNTTMK